MGIFTLAVLYQRLTVPRTTFELVWTVCLTLSFVMTEWLVVHLRVRRGGHAVSLADVPMILGMLVLNPFLAAGTRLLGAAIGLVLIRRQRGTKLAFNVVLVGAQASVAAGCFALIGAVPGGIGWHEFVAAYVASLLADVVAVIAVTAVIALHDDPQEWRRLPAAMRSVPLAAIATTITLVSWAAAGQRPLVLVLLGMMMAAVYLAYQAFVQQRHSKSEVEQLYAFTRALDGVVERAEVMPVLLDQICVQLRAGLTELIVPESGGVVRFQAAGTGELSTIKEAVNGHAMVEECLLRGAEPDLITVPVAIGDNTAALIVAKSLPDAGPFTDARRHLLEALANHAGVALTKAMLVDEVRQEAAEKEYLALHDSLSGLPNRQYFHRLADEAINGPDGERVAVLVIDIKGFAETNNALGYETGDALLVEVGARLTDRLAGHGVVARLGSDEFAVLLPNASGAAETVALAEELASVIERPVVHGPITLNIRASIGVAHAASAGMEALALVRQADIAVYAAKQAHCGVRVYDPAMNRDTPQRLARIDDLRRAIEERTLTVAFQPKVEPTTLTVIGAEALGRWHHAEHGMIPPDEFIPLAEHSGLIRPLTLHVLETALDCRAQWAQNGHTATVAVNLSPNSLADDKLPELVTRLLEQTGTPPSALTLEITESTLMTDPDGAAIVLQRLHALGVNLSIDDFGTGYSSLSRLRSMPIDEMKIDKSFVQTLPDDASNRALVRSAIQMGHALGLRVVAEGVESAQAMAYLASVGCDVAQGFHVSRPLPADEFARWLARQPAERPAVAAVLGQLHLETSADAAVSASVAEELAEDVPRGLPV